MSLTTTDKSKLNECLKMAEVAEKAIDMAITIKKDNDEILAKFNAAYKIWEAERNAYFTKMDQWKKRTGEFSKFYDMENEKKQWYGCYDRPGPGICTSTVQINDNECRKLGSDFVDTGGRTGCNTTWTGCVRGQKRECKRSTNIINSLKVEYESKKPFLRDAPKYGEGAFPIKQTPPMNVVMSCCSNTMILSGNVEAKNNVQSCSIQVKQELANQAAAEKAAAEKAAAEKAAAEKAAADKAAAEKAAADKAAADKAAADKAAADKAAAEKASGSGSGSGSGSATATATSSTAAKSNTMLYMGGGGSFLLCCSCCCCCIILLIVIMMISGGNSS